MIAKTLNTEKKMRVLKAKREKPQCVHKRKCIRLTADFSVETLKARRP